MKVSVICFLILLTAAFAPAQVSPHGPLNIPCQTCHSTDTWSMRKDTLFDHASTGFPLSGQHRSVKCASCHTDLKFSEAQPKCNTCHTDVHKSELGENCLRCHSSQTWKITDMAQRHQETRFTLLGKHRMLTCEGCHHNAVNFQYSGTPLTCIGCHRSDYQATTNPNHAAAGFPTDCARCHTVTAFEWNKSFDHTMTAFPLTGAHRAAPCSQCHGDNVFKGKPTQCIGCHQTDFTATVNPNHVQGGFPTDCITCHTTTAWNPATFNHNNTNFALTGKHAATQCQQCHVNNNYQLTFASCYQCHQSDFQGTTNPNHVSANFSHNCQSCHSTTSWSGATFNHSTTNFPLTGKHTTTLCQQCHVNGNYQLTYSSCYQCHQSDFTGTTNPNHVTSNFSHTCQTCHSTTDWSGAAFDHATTNFALTGKHATIQCQDCHVSNNYQLTYTACYQCHQTDFAVPTNPNHVTLNFDHNCQTCHTTNVWKPSTFNHDQLYFKINSGAHHGKWTACTDCHTNNSNYADFSCLNCHAHAQTTMDSRHSQVRNYIYASPSCYSCHRNV